MFEIFPVIFGIMFTLVITMFIVQAVKGIGQWQKNNASPVLNVEAEVVSKRSHVSHHHHSDADGMGHSSSSTTYYVTFEVKSGSRMELRVHGREYGQLREGDRGELVVQGSRYLNFVRT